MRILPLTVSAPAKIPVTLAQLRGQVRVDDAAEDAMLIGYLYAAIMHVEKLLKRPIMPRTVVAVFEAWPDQREQFRIANPAPTLELLMPVTSVDLITYASTGVAPVTWTAWVARNSPGGVTHVRPAAGDDWPLLGDDPVITLSATAGYAAVPEAIVQAILLTGAHFYVNREAAVIGSYGIPAETPIGVTELIEPHRWHTLV